TGVKNNKHGILSEDLGDNRFQNYPILFDRINDINPKISSEVLTSSSKLESLLKKSTSITKLQSDEEVKNKLVVDIKNTDKDIVAAHFTDIDRIGQTQGYDNSIPQYKAAIEKFDEYVGEIISSLKSRQDYS